MIPEPIVFVFAVLGWSVLHLAWQGLILGAIAETIGLALRRGSPRHREWVAGLALVLLAGAFVITAFRMVGGALEIGPARLAGPGVSLPPGWLVTLAPWIGLAWTVGASLLVLRLLVGLARCRWLRADGTPVTLDLEPIRARLRIEAQVPILVSQRLEVPALVGWLRPMILLPAHTARSLSPPEIEALLAHELAHLRRWDRWTKALGQVARSLFFFHPVAHRLVGRLDVERELACDDIAVAACGSPAVYARALASLEHARQQGGVRVLAADGAPLLARIRRIAEPAHRRDERVDRRLAFAGMALLFLFAQAPIVSPHLPGPYLPETIASLVTHGTSHKDHDVHRIRHVRKTPHH